MNTNQLYFTRLRDFTLFFFVYKIFFIYRIIVLFICLYIYLTISKQLTPQRKISVMYIYAPVPFIYKSITIYIFIYIYSLTIPWNSIEPADASSLYKDHKKERFVYEPYIYIYLSISLYVHLTIDTSMYLSDNLYSVPGDSIEPANAYSLYKDHQEQRCRGAKWIQHCY